MRGDNEPLPIRYGNDLIRDTSRQFWLILSAGEGKLTTKTHEPVTKLHKTDHDL